MSTWACPNCFAPCGDAESLVEHLVSSYLGEQTFTPSTFSNKRKRRASVADDNDYGNRQAESKLDYICPYPRCGNKKQYSSKANLLRHFFTHCTDSEAVNL
ncbi:hypothetical protein LY78DRAFT_664708 [Colletotrichum sublineola]|nr:hypothetical protein LY78DRAFT_664708 [Colletotrichum sublineola]